jgi:hypothetical protein
MERDVTLVGHRPGLLCAPFSRYLHDGPCAQGRLPCLPVSISLSRARAICWDRRPGHPCAWQKGDGVL